MGVRDFAESPFFLPPTILRPGTTAYLVFSNDIYLWSTCDARRPSEEVPRTTGIFCRGALSKVQPVSNLRHRLPNSIACATYLTSSRGCP